MKTNMGLTYHCHHAVGEAYMWGAFGQEITERFILQKAAQYPSHYTESYIQKCRKNIGKLAYDCVGLIKSYYWGAGNYSADTDFNTETMFLVAREKGTIESLPERPGVILYRKGHVGVYIGKGELIEARDVSSGVVGSKVSGRGFTHWFQCPYISAEEEKTDLEECRVILQNWQWDMLGEALKDLKNRQVIDSGSWISRVEDRELTSDELAWLSLIVAQRISE